MFWNFFVKYRMDQNPPAWLTSVKSAGPFFDGNFTGRPLQILRWKNIVNPVKTLCMKENE